MMTRIEDRPTLSLTAALATGALAEARSRRDLTPVAQTPLSCALRTLFMTVMSFYMKHKDLSMSVELVQALHMAPSALATMRGEFMILNLLIERMERDVAVCDLDVRLALVQATTVLDHIITS
jgi:hypothetical protein